MKRNFQLSLIVVWDNPVSKKIVRYELHVGDLVEKSGEFFELKNGEKIEIPKCTTVISGVKIPKYKAELLKKFDVPVAAGYYLGDNF